MLGCYSASVDVIHLGIEAGAAAAAARGKQSTACLPAVSSLTPTVPRHPQLREPKYSGRAV
jgi:hypothetical protein